MMRTTTTTTTRISLLLPLTLLLHNHTYGFTTSSLLLDYCKERSFSRAKFVTTAVGTSHYVPNAVHVPLHPFSQSCDDDDENNGVDKNIYKWKQQLHGMIRAAVLALALFVAPILTVPDSHSAYATETGGRMGGSFSRSSSSRSSYGSGSSRAFRSGSSFSSPRYYGSGGGGVGPTVIAPIVPVPIGGPIYAAPRFYNPLSGIFNFFFNGIFLLVLATALTQIFTGNRSSLGAVDSPLGSGVTVATLSIALNVPKRDDPSSILSYLTRLSNTARTDSRVGLKNLVSQVALELLRQRRSIFAAKSEYKHYSNSDKATRDYNQIAIQQRSKFEKETISKYKGVDYSATKPSSLSVVSTSGFQATVAVVTFVIAIEGDSTKLPSPIRSLNDVEKALTQVATDVNVDDCLLSAEVLWTPGDTSEILTERDIIVDYPDLRTL